ncbi:hypothetical protein ACLJYM_23565 [Rhizobium giardinii]|uniref:hypothetical protein n=1 Tax=Rhizobium giardinii TaxID=56731 RepID=UPI000DD97B52
MSLKRKLKIALVAIVLMFPLLGAEDPISGPGLLGFIGSAEARVGRPLTPVSVAGVARRTVRRCAVGVYYC